MYYIPGAIVERLADIYSDLKLLLQRDAVRENK